MPYNFISAIRSGEFSLRKDYEETWNHLGKLGLDKIVDTTIPILGKINKKTSTRKLFNRGTFRIDVSCSSKQ